MTSVTIYGGVGEIGGNKVLVESGETRILLDFGTRLGYESRFFSDFVNPRTNTALRDRLAIGALPRIPGIYREDMVRPSGYEALADARGDRVLRPDSPYFRLDGVRTYEEYLQDAGKPYVQAIFLSHAHLDHTGAIGYLDHRIPLFCSVVTETMVRAIDEMSTQGAEVLTSKERDVWFTGTRSTFPGTPKIARSDVIERECHTMADGGVVDLDGLRVRLIEVDHSVPGAASFVVEAGDLRILYTGDIRFHGSRPMTVEEYVERIGPIDVLLCEGTRVDSRQILYEQQVGLELRERFERVWGLVLIDFSWKDTTRFETVRDAAAHAGRTLVINARLAYLLHRLRMDPGTNVKVFLKRRDSCLYSPSDYTRAKHEYGPSTDWDEAIDSTHYDDGLVAEQIRADPGRYVLMLSYYDLGQLFDFADAEGQIPGSLFIKAQCEPFSDEMEIDEERLINWLDMFGVGYFLGKTPLPDGCTNPQCSRLHQRVERSHVSGHASRPELLELISLLGPKVVIPVHTESPEAFLDIASELKEERGQEIRVILPKKGDKYSFW
ncbi:MAG TPA: MBL fold metallo-hydrolase [Thermoplasmata archaeon]|nr:MBL fold metallo-hydrolase [Thermoplasmata archaeon]